MATQPPSAKDRLAGRRAAVSAANFRRPVRAEGEGSGTRLTGLFEPLCVPFHCKSFIPAVPGADSNGGGVRVLAKFANDPLQQVHVSIGELTHSRGQMHLLSASRQN